MDQLIVGCIVALFGYMAGRSRSEKKGYDKGYKAGYPEGYTDGCNFAESKARREAIKWMHMGR